jgi:hypothetical protein
MAMVVILVVGCFSNYSHYFVVVWMVELLFELIVMVEGVLFSKLILDQKEVLV